MKTRVTDQEIAERWERNVCAYQHWLYSCEYRKTSAHKIEFTLTMIEDPIIDWNLDQSPAHVVKLERELARQEELDKVYFLFYGRPRTVAYAVHDEDAKRILAYDQGTTERSETRE